MGAGELKFHGVCKLSARIKRVHSHLFHALIVLYSGVAKVNEVEGIRINGDSLRGHTLYIGLGCISQI